MTRKKRWTFFPRDSEQSIRIKRFLMAAVSYVMWIILCGICIINDLTFYDFHDLFYLSIVVVLTNLCLYVLFRFGINKRFYDPSLTMVQMIIASLWTMVLLYGADEVRGTMLMIYCVIFVFGVFRLRIYQFLFLSFFALISYAVVIYFLFRFHPNETNFKAELINLLFVATVMPWFALVGSYITHLRTTIAKALETIEKLAVIDELTQVYNRRRLLEILKEQKSLCDRGNKTFSICIFDLDHFKKVNDTYGHETGDNVLKKVAETIRQNIRDIDTIARYGGEEFMLVLTGAKRNDAMLFAERVREMSEKIRFGQLDDFNITISIGVSEYVPHEDFQDTINRADTALYRAKKYGRNRVEFERRVESKQLYLF